MKTKVMLFALCILAMTSIEMLQAAQQWQEPLCVRNGRNIKFAGTGIDCSDGGYILTWTETNPIATQSVFQRYNADNEPQWDAPKVIAQYATYLAMEEVESGCFLIMMNFNSQVRVFKINSAGEHIWNSHGQQVFIDGERVICKKNAAGGVYFLIIGMYENISVNYVSPDGVQHPMGIPIGYQDYNTDILPSLLVTAGGDAVIIFSDRQRTQHLIRLTSDLSVVWEREYSNVWNQCATFIDEESFLVVSTYRRISVMRYDLDGVPLWDDFVTLADSTGFLYRRSAITRNPEGGFFIGWLGDDCAFIQQVDMDSNILAEPEQVTLPLYPLICDLYFKVDANDNAYMVIWDNEEATNCYALVLDESGFASSDAVTIYNTMYMPFFRQYPFLRFCGSNLQVIYNRLENDLSQIEYGLLSPSGHILDAGVCIVGGTFALTSGIKVIPNANSIMVAWREAVPYFFIEENIYTLRYQIVSPEGNMLLPQPGRLPASGMAVQNCFYKTITLESGEVVVLWLNTSGTPEIRAQLIDNSGTQLWEPEGRLIYAGAILSLTDNDPLCVSIIDNAIYVVWLQDIPPSREIRGQKIVNGELQWELDGKVLVSLTADLWNLVNMAENYVVLERWFTNCTFGDAVRVYTFDENGLALPGFEPGGVFPSPLPEYSVFKYRQSIPSPNGLVLRTDVGEVVDDWPYPQPLYQYSYEHLLDSSGELPWGIYGIGIPPAYLLIADETGIYERYDIDENKTLFKRSYDSTQVWASPCSLSRYTTRVDYGAVSIGNGLYLGIALISDPDANMPAQYYGFDSTGNVYIPEDKILDNRSITKGASFCSFDNYAYVGWHLGDYYSQKTSPFIFMQKLNLDTVANQDPIEEAHLVSIRSNSPNPFSQNTRFQIQCTSSSQSSVEIFNLKGQLVRFLYDGVLSKGNSTLEWNGKDNRGVEVGSGVYFCSVRANGDQQDTIKILKMK